MVLLPVGAATDISLSSYPVRRLLYPVGRHGLIGALAQPTRPGLRRYTAQRAVREEDACRVSRAGDGPTRDETLRAVGLPGAQAPRLAASAGPRPRLRSRRSRCLGARRPRARRFGARRPRRWRPRPRRSSRAGRPAPCGRARAPALAPAPLRDCALRRGPGAGLDAAERAGCQRGYVGGGWHFVRGRPGQAGAAGAAGGHARIEAATGRRGGLDSSRYRLARRRAVAACAALTPAGHPARDGPAAMKGK